VAVSEKIFPALECAIVFVVSCLAFVSFHGPSLVVHVDVYVPRTREKKLDFLRKPGERAIYAAKQE